MSQLSQVGDDEATYASSSNHPTNQLDNYISLRITLSHEHELEVLNVFKDCDYVIMKHVGSGNQHFHICIIGDHVAKDVERYRKRVKDQFGLRGPGQVAAKSMSNGVDKFVSYVKHEAGEPYLKGYEIERFRSIPAFVKKTMNDYVIRTEKRKHNPDTFYQISYRNMIKTSLRYRETNSIESTQLEDTLSHMCHNGWEFQVTVLRQGIPTTFFEQFTAMCTGGNIMVPGRINRMRVDEHWRIKY